MKISFPTKVAISTFITATIAVAVVALLSFNLMVEYFKQNSLENLEFELKEDVKNIDNSIKKVVYDAKILSKTDNLIAFFRAYHNKYHYDAVTNNTLSGIEKTLQDSFTALLTHNTAYFNVRLLSAQGKELIVAYKDKRGIHVREKNALQDKSGKTYFLEAKNKAEGEVYISDINLNREYGKISYPLTPTIRVALPIYINNKLFAIIIINANVEKLFTILHQYNFKDSPKSIYIADANGYYIYHPDKSKIFGYEFGYDNYTLMHDFDLSKKAYYSDKLLFCYTKHFYTDKKFVYVALTSKTRFSQEQYNHFISSLMLYVFLIALLVAAVSLLFIRKLIHPIVELTQTAREIAEGEKNERIKFKTIDSKDEIGELTLALKTMLEKLEKSKQEVEKKVQERTEELNALNANLEKAVKEKTQENIKQLQALQQQSKLASMGEMIGAIAHQWRQPLNEISIAIQNLKYDYEDGLVTKEYLEDFINSNKQVIKFMSDTIDDFRNFYRVDKTKERFNVKDAIEKTLSIQKAQLTNNNISVELKGEGFEVEGYKNEFQQVILNLINNAKDVLLQKEVKDGRITIEIQNKTISIRDNGGGIPDDVMQRIFEPYFTTKEQGKGTGMGLYMSKMIIEENMDAKLEVRNTPEGAEFRIIFDEKA